MTPIEFNRICTDYRVRIYGEETHTQKKLLHNGLAIDDIEVFITSGPNSIAYKVVSWSYI